MVLGLSLIQIEKTTQDEVSSSSNPLFGLVDLFLIGATVFNKIQSFFPQFWLFLLSQLNSKVRTEKQVSDSELSHQQSLIHGSRDNGVLRRDEVEMVMKGLFGSSESEELEETYDFNELSGMFEEEEPSLEEAKQAFDVFDVDKDGFIDERELQRVLYILGLKEAASEQGNCQKMIRNFDENGDGRIDFKEFLRIMEKSFC